ncbi:MAG: SpoIID/LytB domain-containing protein [Acidaminococcaceae bacterium]
MLKLVISLLIGLTLQWGNASAAEPLGPDIVVGLVVGQFSVELNASAPYEVLEVATGNRLVLPAGKTFISVKNKTLQVAGKAAIGDTIRIISPQGEGTVAVNRKHYRGQLVVVLSSDCKKLSVHNSLPLEEYLAGVVAKDIRPLWPEAAIKAQIIAARSLALSKLGQAKNAEFDVRANEPELVYGGITAENSKINKILATTCGLALTYQGRPLVAFTHSSSGGYTENSENVVGLYWPYLRGVPDYDQEAPEYSWEKVLTALQLEKSLTQAGYLIGKLESIGLSPLKAAPLATTDRGISGRVKRIEFNGSQGKVVLEGIKFQQLLQLKSTLFDVEITTPVPNFIEVPIIDRYGNEIGKKKIPVQAPKKEQPKFLEGFSDLRLVSGSAGEKLIFKGYGEGHGLGLSYWGARAMALQAPASSSDYYETILLHYYAGAQVEKIY